jgi:hypothetical protein
VADQETGPIPGVDVQSVVAEIQQAILYAGLDHPEGQGGMSLETVRIEMAAVAEIEVGMKPRFKIPVVGWEIGGERRTTDVETHTIDVTLRTPWAPVTEVAGKGAERLRGLDVETALPGVIAAVRELLLQAGQGPARLDFGCATMAFKFDVSRTGRLELVVPEMSRTRQSAVTVTFTFAPPPTAGHGG